MSHAIPSPVVPGRAFFRREPALDGHRLWVRFSDANEGVRDLSDLIATRGPMVEPLQAPDYFARAFVEMGAPT